LRGTREAERRFKSQPIVAESTWRSRSERVGRDLSVTRPSSAIAGRSGTGTRDSRRSHVNTREVQRDAEHHLGIPNIRNRG